MLREAERVRSMRREDGGSCEQLRAALESGGGVVGVVGLGYVGLPLAVAFGERGLRTIGIEPDPRKRAALSAGHSYLPDVPEKVLGRLVAEGRLTISPDCGALREADAILICVPTPVFKDKRPDLSAVLEVGEALAAVLRRGQLVVLESTCYPGTTDETLRSVLERGSGLRAGEDFWLAFSPERVDPGNQKFPLTNIPKVVGGICRSSTELAAALYSHIAPKVIEVSSCREAEMCKLIENTFRHVNIALANELAIVSEGLGIDFWEAVGAASSKPFGFMPFYPGPGVGGHCIPVDPHYLSWKARQCELPLRLIDVSEEINDSMPHHVVGRLVKELSSRGVGMKRARVLVLGASYKRGVGDVRGSPGLRIMELLEAQGAVVAYHDPYVPTLPRRGGVMSSVPLGEGVLSSQDCVVLVTDHDYDLGLVLRASRLLIDTRNAVKGDSPNCVRLWARNGHGTGVELATEAARERYRESPREPGGEAEQIGLPLAAPESAGVPGASKGPDVYFHHSGFEEQ